MYLKWNSLLIHFFKLKYCWNCLFQVAHVQWGPLKVNNFSFLAGKPSLTIFCFGKYLFSDPRFISYHLGNTRMDYLPKENIAVKNSWLRVSLTLGHLPALPPPGWEKSVSVVEWWGLERRWARWLSLCSLWHPLPSPQKQRQPLTIHLYLL